MDALVAGDYILHTPIPNAELKSQGLVYPVKYYIENYGEKLKQFSEECWISPVYVRCASIGDGEAL
ncbi:hypothetical protein N483_09255 [Pseudoalteromonas luteoviolacea NCIMB 1944]|nr:hypothetical protein N483_09255 [Pseudoalteromonas luteoviolacea NCIMB 1944]